MPDVEITLVGFFLLGWFGFFVWRWGVYVLMSVLRIFWAGEQMVAGILTARVSLSGTTDRRLSCDL